MHRDDSQRRARAQRCANEHRRCGLRGEHKSTQKFTGSSSLSSDCSWIPFPDTEPCLSGTRRGSWRTASTSHPPRTPPQGRRRRPTHNTCPVSPRHTAAASLTLHFSGPAFARASPLSWKKAKRTEQRPLT